MTEMYGGSPSAFNVLEEDEEDQEEQQAQSEEADRQEDGAQSSGSPARQRHRSVSKSPVPRTPHAVNAFDVLRAGADKAARRSRSPSVIERDDRLQMKGKNQFIAAEADMDEEEEALFGGQSGDEDENGLDAELEELVDHGPVDLEQQAKEDALADQLRR
jgi:hypothetical protein